MTKAELIISMQERRINQLLDIIKRAHEELWEWGVAAQDSVLETLEEHKKGPDE